MTDAAAALRAFALLLVATPGSLSYNQPLPPPSQAPSTVAREGAGNGLDRRAALSAATAAVTAGGVILPGTAASAAAAAVPTTMLGDLEVSQTIQGYWQLAGGHGEVRTPTAFRGSLSSSDPLSSSLCACVDLLVE